MVDLGNEGGGLPVAGDGQNQPPAATETLGAPVVAPAAPTNPGAPPRPIFFQCLRTSKPLC